MNWVVCVCHKMNAECNKHWDHIRYNLSQSQRQTYLVPHGTFFTSSVCNVVCETKANIHALIKFSRCQEHKEMLRKIWIKIPDNGRTGSSPATQYEISVFKLKKPGYVLYREEKHRYRTSWSVSRNAIQHHKELNQHLHDATCERLPSQQWIILQDCLPESIG